MIEMKQPGLSKSEVSGFNERAYGVKGLQQRATARRLAQMNKKKNKDAKKNAFELKSPNPNETSVLIRSYMLDVEEFKHLLYTQTDDRVEVVRLSDNKIILTFDSSTNVFDGHGVRIGDIRDYGAGEMVFRNKSGLEKEMPLCSSRSREAYLDAEVVFAKFYINAMS